MRKQVQLAARLTRITEDISASLVFEDILKRVYKSFRSLLPYDRIGLALIDNSRRMVQAIGTRSSSHKVHLLPGFSAPIKGSSLAKILRTGKPRIINDLLEYLSEHPQSDSTRRIVAEGMRSSLTYPLIAQGKPVGFIFFSSMRRDTYAERHIDSFRRIATLLSIAVENCRLYKELEESDEMKNRVIGIASHDLRNPLTVMIGHMALMQESSGNEALTEQITIVQRNCKKMLSIIDNLLDASVIQSGRFKLSLHSLDIRELLQQLCSDSRILAERKSIGLKLELPPTLPLLTADRSRLQQAFDNLISNAIKYSMPQTAITLSAQVVGDTVQVSVADQGQGIPPLELSLLFKEFGGVSVKPTADERSVGLGLSIVRRIVKAHGGTIRVESRPGVGSTFIVSLPLHMKTGSQALVDLNH